MNRLFLGMVVIFLLVLGFSGNVCAISEAVDLEKIVVNTPTRIGQEGYKVSSDVSIINSKEIESSGANYVTDVLEQELGIYYYDNSTVKTSKIDIRGFGDTAASNILLMIDGRKVNSVDISGSDWMQIPVEAIERIEIIRGAGSVLYGDNAVGGVVNIITKKGQGKISGSASISLGSYGMEKEDVEISGSQGKTNYYLYSKYFDTDGYRSNSDVRAKDFNTRIGYDVTENTSLDLSANWHEDDYGMPGGLDDISELVQYGRRGSPDEMDFASTKDRHVKFSVNTRPWFDVAESSSFSFDTFYRNKDKYSWFYYGGWPTATKYNIDTVGVTTKYVYQGILGTNDLNCVVGTDYYDTEHGILGSANSTDELTITKEEIGFYGYSEYEAIDNVFVNGGVRYQKADYVFDQQKSSVRHEKQDPSETVFMGGIKYDYAEGSSAHVSVQEIFRFLATDEWYSTWSGLKTNLRHQKGIQYEAGIKHKINDNFTISITPYWMKLEDEIYVNPYPSPGQNENYDKTDRKGIEMGLNVDLLDLVNLSFIDSLTGFANYTYQEAKFKDGDYTGSDIPLVPRHQASVGINMNFLDNYGFSLAGKYVGEKYAINDVRNELSKVKDYFVLDTKVSYKRDAVEFFAGANNILNREYYSYVAKSASSNKKDYYPAPERNFEIGIKYSF